MIGNSGGLWTSHNAQKQMIELIEVEVGLNKLFTPEVQI